MSLLWVQAKQVSALSTGNLWGAGHVDALFNENPMTVSPFPQIGRTKSRPVPYDRETVRKALSQPAELQHVDPRTLHGTQGGVTRAGVKHYMENDWEKTGETYADHHNVGNKHPVVYRRADGKDILLSGHHRGTAALLQGKMLPARVIEGP